MKYDIKDNSIIICKNSIKNTILLYMSKNKIIKNISFMSINEFKNNYFGMYDVNAIYYLMKNMGYSYDTAILYLNNIFYNYDKLNDLYKKLNDNNLLILNNTFKGYLNNKNIYVIGYNNLDKYILNELNKYNTTYINDEENNYTHEVYACKDQSDEINFVFQSIIDNHINELDKVFLVNVSSDYNMELKRLAKLYNLNININESNSIYSNSNISLFINNLKETKDLNTSLDLINDIDIKNKVIDVINSNYISEIDDTYIEIIINLLKSTYKDKIIYENGVNIIDFDDIYDSDNYYYVMNFNQGVIPKVFHDDDFISDEEKIKLGINTSLDNVLNYKNKVINKLNNYKNIVITYKQKDYFNVYEPSYLIDELKLKVNKASIKHNYSNKLNKINLGIKLDDYTKFNIKDELLNDLYTTYQESDYLTYDNKFKGVSYDLIKKYTNNDIRLSYTSMNSYFNCSFKYYIESILKLNIFEDTFYTLIGKLYHDVLSHMYDDNFDLKTTYDNFLKDKELTSKETFFINNLYKELESIIDVIRFQDTKTKLDNNMTEKEYIIDKSSDINITFKGFVDKIKYKVIDGVKYISIIDYKTGSIDTSLDNINHGLNLQLPVYVYLIKKSEDNSRIIGFYLQKILHGKSDEELKNKLKLIGYTINDEEKMAYMDLTYEDSEVIKSLKKGKSGFYKYCKLISEEEINNMIDIVDNHINSVIKSIKEGNFEINPKRIDNELVGCKFCKYKDLCYRKEENIKDLPYTSFEQIVGGEEDGLD